MDRELAATEDAMDRVYDLLRPGADRQADRRTRAACLEVAQDRLKAVQAALVTSGVPNVDGRVRLLKPQFNPDAGADGGRVVMTVVSKKK